MKYLLVSFLILLHFTSVKSETKEQKKGPIASTPYGDIEGFVYRTHNDVDVNVFLGVRYGRAPDHIHRFEKPEMVEKWNGLLHHAKRYKASCIPFHRDALMRENYSEDCLFLNIVTPKNMNPEKKYPVFVFVHGGGYEIGDTEMIGYKNASANFVTKDIIFVSVQYRLGPLGFLTTGTKVNKGNLGLWDLTLSLLFLNEVIPSFGGDPNQITLGGHSAGAAAVSALMFSPHSDHLFNQAVEMSGSVFCEFSMSESVVEESKALIDAVGCTDASEEKVHDCLKERTVDELLDGVEKIGSSRRHINFIKFHPHFDNDFFSFSPDNMARKAPPKKTMQGVTSLESGLFSAVSGIEYVADLLIKESRWTNFTREEVLEFMTSAVATEKEHGRKMGPFLQLVTEFYLGEEDADKDSTFYLQKYTELLSDLQFFIPSYHEIDLKRMLGWETYYYVIDHISDTFNHKTPLKGTFHGHELRFLLSFLDTELIPLSDNDKKFQDAFLGASINFIKTGNPSTKQLKWPPVSKEAPSLHLRLNENSSIQKSFRSEAIKLWLEVIPKQIGTDILKQNRLPAAHAHTKHTEL
ncbi:unnamed protein product [Auanema sp. JU1783]|nr:unnamed protein product [Auanema sp. JU1783]